MPIKGKSPKKVMETEMGKFKRGSLHSGSKTGPVVKSRKQAVAIAMKESGKSKYPGAGGADPTERSTAAADVALPHAAQGKRTDDSFNTPLGEIHPQANIGSAMKAGTQEGPPPASAPAKLGPAPAPLPAARSHGFGHSATQRVGHLRTSGNRSAHRLGKR